MKKKYFLLLQMAFLAIVSCNFGLPGMNSEVDNHVDALSDRALISNYKKAVYTASSLYVIKKSDMTDSEKVMIASLQGVLANKTSVQIYIEPEDFLGYSKWLDDLHTNYGISYSYVQDPWILLSQFKSYIDGYILWQTGDNSLNAASSLANYMNSILVATNIESDAVSQGLMMTLDARNKDEAWVMDNYWSYLSHEMVVEQKEEMNEKLRDYGIMSNAFTFFDGNSSWRASVLDSLDDNSMVLGWGDASNGENQFISPSSQAGTYYIPADHTYNLSTLSGFSVSSLTQNSHEIPVVEDNVHYVTFIMSDGDNVQWLLGSFSDTVGRNDWFGNPSRGNFDMGWGMAPELIDLAPTVMSWYYNNASNGPHDDYFVVGPSGSGYMYPSEYPSAELDQHLSRLNSYMGITDLSIVEVIDFNTFNNNALWDKYTAQPNIDGVIYLEYTNHAAQNGAVNWSNGKPIVSPREVLWDGVSGGDNASVISSLNLASRDPYSTAGYSVVLVHAWSKTLTDVQAVVDGLDSDVRVVTPEVLFSLMTENCDSAVSGELSWEAEADFGHNTGRVDSDGWSANAIDDSPAHMLWGPPASNIPTGNHNVNFRMMIDNNNTVSERVANLDIYNQTSGQIVGELAVGRYDFAAEYSYQDFLINADFVLGDSYEFRVWYDDRVYIRVDNVSIEGVQPTPSMEWEAEADFGHNAGRGDGEGWSATPAYDSPAHMLWGPPASNIPTGNHNVNFRMMIDSNNTISERVANLDIYNQTSGQIVGELAVSRYDFTAEYVYQDFLIYADFILGDSYEFRVWYDDKAYINVDKVIVQ